jgi:apolipoprotein N-acyltransferase
MTAPAVRRWLQAPTLSFGIALLAGAAAVAAFAPIDAWPLALLALALLFAQWHEARTWRTAFATGFAFGLGFFLTGVSWVYVSMHTYGDMAAPLAGLATLAFCAGLALFPATAGALVARLTARGAPRLLAACGAWVLLDAARALPFNGFPWLAMGYSQIDTPLAGLAPLLGVHGVALALALSAAALSAAALAAIDLRPARLAWVLAAAPWIVGTLARDLPWTAAIGEPVSVALIQGNIAQDMKFDPAQYGRTLEHYARAIESTQARLVVLPETAVPRMANAVDPAWWARVRDHALRTGADVLLGVPTGDLANRYYNSVISLGTSPGQIYSKRHLVPLGEYIPAGFDWILAVLHIPMSAFSPGPDNAPALAVAGERIGVNICYEDAFGGEIIRALPDASMLVNVSNIAWFGDSLAPGQHLQMSRMRALETGRDMLRATNTGMTAIIRSDGTTRTLPAFAAGILEGHAQGRQGMTPYARFGNTPALGLALALLAAAAGLARRARRTRATPRARVPGEPPRTPTDAESDAGQITRTGSKAPCGESR